MGLSSLPEEAASTGLWAQLGDKSNAPHLNPAAGGEERRCGERRGREEERRRGREQRKRGEEEWRGEERRGGVER